MNFGGKPNYTRRQRRRHKARETTILNFCFDRPRIRLINSLIYFIFYTHTCIKYSFPKIYDLIDQTEKWPIPPANLECQMV